MQTRESVTIGEQTIEVRTLTVEEVLDVVEGRNIPEQVIIVDALMEHKIRSELLQKCTTITPEQMLAMAPQELHLLADKVAALNPFSVRLFERVGVLHEQTTSASA